MAEPLGSIALESRSLLKLSSNPADK